jgi:ribonuclease D
MSAELITDHAALADLCRALEGSEWLALDTEFLRERTYSARLCLVQIANREIVACIDPLAIADLTPLTALLHRRETQKVLHAARQDLEVLFDIDRRVPEPLFDTQIAAACLGYDDQIGYGALVREITGVELDKTHTRTDWSMRPLSAAQLRYAADDVRYLRPVYEALLEKLHARGRAAWVSEDCARLADTALYLNDPDEAWRRLRGGADLAPAAQQLLRALAVWREREAQTRNLPRSWVVRDEALFELARRAPQTGHELEGIRALEDGARRRFGPGILECIADGRRAEPVVLWPRLAPLTAEQIARTRELMVRIREFAQEHSLASAALATRRDVEKLVRGATPAEVWHGWRLEFLGPWVQTLLPA